jgi:hypothetical protein
LWAKSWKGRTILSTDRRCAALMQPLMPPRTPEELQADRYAPECLEGEFCEVRSPLAFVTVAATPKRR